MSNVKVVLMLLRCGAKLRVIHDYWGAAHARVSLPWLGWPRLTFTLSQHELDHLRTSLRGSQAAGERASARGHS